MALILTRKVGDNIIIKVGNTKGKISVNMVDRNYVKLAFEGDIEVVREELAPSFFNRKKKAAP